MDSTGLSSAETGKSTELLKRALSVLVLVPLVIGAIWAGGWILVFFILAILVLMLGEWNRLTSAEASVPVLVFQAAFLGVAIIAAALGEYLAAFAIIGAGAVLAVGLAMAVRRAPVWVFLPLIYFAIPLISLMWLRAQPGAGLQMTIGLLVLVWASDVGAYAAGTTIGGPRLAPRISPNKTWAGAVGGLVLSGIAAIGVGSVWSLGTPLFLFALGAGLSVAAQLGDLAESAVKRRFGVKDSGTLIPGHGGILDRIDSLLLLAPVAAALLYLSGTG